MAGSWVCPRPLARSDSENVYEAIPDVRCPPREERPTQVGRRDRGDRREVAVSQSPADFLTEVVVCPFISFVVNIHVHAKNVNGLDYWVLSLTLLGG